jgi:dihydroxyacetone kinase-like protein
MTALGTALEAAATTLVAQADELTRLDSLQGDGDLGRTAGLIAGALRAASTDATNDPATVLRECGTRIAAAAPSSSGTLIASGFLAAAKSLADEPMNPVVTALAAGIAGIGHRGKAQPGDRTMLDALAPALAALEADAADRDAAAAAAERGIEATRDMEAKFGRARFLAGNAIGEPDPGAAMVGTALAAALRAT